MKAKIKLASQPLGSPELKQDRVYSSTKQIAPTISQMCRFLSQLLQVGVSGAGVPGIGS